MNSTLTNEEINRYSQQISLCELDKSGQEKIKSASVLVIGAGGLGCPVLQYLTVAGIGKIGIVDPDHVELSNLHRQILYTDQDRGKLKVEVAIKKLSFLNPHVTINPFPCALTLDNAQSLIEEYDLVIDATDNFSARYVINDVCTPIRKTWIYGSIQRFTGQIAVFKGYPDYRALYPTVSHEIPNCSEGGVIGALPGIIGSMQALEAIKILADITPVLIGKMLTFDGKTMQTHIYTLSSQLLNSIEITEENLAEMILKKEQIQLIDLREEEERLKGDFGGIWIPFTKLFSCLEQLPKDKKIVFYCKRGFRSLKAAQQVRKELQLQEVYSLKGGFDRFES